jgi:hypothetical protein
VDAQQKCATTNRPSVYVIKSVCRDEQQSVINFERVILSPSFIECPLFVVYRVSPLSKPP